MLGLWQLVAAAVISADGVVTETEKSEVVGLVKEEFGHEVKSPLGSPT